MAVFAQPSNESFNPKQEQYFLGTGSILSSFCFKINVSILSLIMTD